MSKFHCLKKTISDTNKKKIGGCSMCIYNRTFITVSPLVTIPFIWSHMSVFLVLYMLRTTNGRELLHWKAAGREVLGLNIVTPIDLIVQNLQCFFFFFSTLIFLRKYGLSSVKRNTTEVLLPILRWFFFC